uniref:Junctophilin n=1 Tax=Meloidogyne javanica TaxID=6303 RepID=A0A915N9M9_MELJA
MILFLFSRKAHGHGVCTGPDGQGEYTGAWHYGFEVSGVYTWPSGSTYSGQWQNGKRHGLGVEQRGRWTYKGEWTQGYKGRYGRREALNSGAHYLGTWSSGLHDGYGTEIYSDGGSYKGQWLRGMRHGYGIRTSAPWSLATPNNHQHHSEQQQKHRGGHTSLSSLRSNYGSVAMLDDEGAATAMDTPPNHHGRSHSRERRGEQTIQLDESRGGFVLKAYSGTNKRRRSLSERSLAVKRSILQRIRKQNSTGDIIHQQRVFSSAGGASSLRSSGSTLSCTSDEEDSGDLRHPPNSQRSRVAAEAATLEEPPIDANAVEIYRGEWKNDMRSGYGVCERSDGLRYAGEWLDNRKHGYGVTFFRDGTKEEGRYKHNVLVSSARRKGILFVRSTKLRHRVEIYAEHARQAADMAGQRVEIATSRTMTAQERADASVEAADRARDDGDTARIYAAQFDPSFKQPGVELLRARAAMQRSGTPGQSAAIPMLTPVHNHVMANHVQFNHHQQQQPHSQTNYSSPSQNNQQYDYSNAFASSQQQQQQDYTSTHPQMINEGGSDTEGGGLLVAASASGGHQSAQHSNIVSYAAAIPPLPAAHIRQQSSSEMATLQKPQPPHHLRGMTNMRGRSSPSTMSLSDDHWDQYLLKSSRREASKHQLLPGTSSSGLDTPHHFRRNRPSLIRQCEVLGASGTIGGSSCGESPSGSMVGTLNRRSTLVVNPRECRQRVPPIHSVYGADDSFRHQDQQQQQPSSSIDIQNQTREERGSLPNLEDLAGQPLQLGREEAARLASQRRQDVHKQMEEEERIGSFNGEFHYF